MKLVGKGVVNVFEVVSIDNGPLPVLPYIGHHSARTEFPKQHIGCQRNCGHGDVYAPAFPS